MSDEIIDTPRRKRYDPDDDLNDEGEIAQDHAGSRQANPSVRARDEYENLGFPANERVWTEFGIKPGLPVRVKVEQLTIVYRLSPEDIADVLGLDAGEVESTIQSLNGEWQSLGRVMSPEEREIARGKMIAELLKLKAEIEEAMVGANSTDKARMLTLKMNVVNQLTQLQGLSLDKREITRSEDSDVDPVESKIAQLPEEKQRELHNRLKAIP